MLHAAVIKHLEVSQLQHKKNPIVIDVFFLNQPLVIETFNLRHY
jgi:hypothetical protein